MSVDEFRTTNFCPWSVQRPFVLEGPTITIGVKRLLDADYLKASFVPDSSIKGNYSIYPCTLRCLLFSIKLLWHSLY